MTELVTLDSPATSALVADVIEKREASAQAAATPLPGPLTDAFAIPPEIKVGKWFVSPFLEGHFELLSALQHPLYDLLIAMFSGKQSVSDYFPSGRKMWELCYLFTHPLEDSEQLVKSGADKFTDAARKEFSRFPTAAMILMHKAIVKQVLLASSTAIAFGNEEEGGSDLKKNHVERV
jgi:hypothetical protein